MSPDKRNALARSLLDSPDTPLWMQHAIMVLLLLPPEEAAAEAKRLAMLFCAETRP